jgi:hypothetical protein
LVAEVFEAELLLPPPELGFVSLLLLLPHAATGSAMALTAATASHLRDFTGLLLDSIA